MDETEIIKWADSLRLNQMEGESTEAFRCRFAWYMLDHYEDPIAAAEIILGKSAKDWSPLEYVKWVIDYAEWFEDHPYSNHRSFWDGARHVYKDAINQLLFIERRRSGEVSSNPVECTTLDGRHAADVGRSDPSRRKRPNWNRGVLTDAPHGYEEAVLKRESFPVDDPDQGHLRIVHVDREGHRQTRQIIPKGEALPQIPCLYPTPGRKTLGGSHVQAYPSLDSASVELED